MLRKTWIRELLNALLLLSGVLYASASKSLERRMADYYVTTWTTADGAPSVIRTISQTADGWLWLSATDGLYRFDGKTFESISNSPGFPREAKGGVSITFAAADGSLWIGVQGGHTARLNDGRWELFSAESDMGNVSIIARDRDGTMWAACSTGLFRLDGKTWRNVGAALGIRQTELLDDLYADGDGSLWIATSNSVYRLGVGASLVESTGIVLADGGSFVPAPDGNLYISSDSQFKRIPLAARNPARFRALNNELQKNGYLSGFNDDGSLWSIQCGNRICGIPNGAKFPEDSSVAALKTEESTPDVRGGMVLNTMTRDRDGNVWVGSNRGLTRYRPNLFLSVPVPPNSASFTLLPDASGGLWLSASSSSQAALLSGNASGLKDVSFPQKVTSGTRAPDGSFWFAGPDGIWKLEAGQLLPQSIAPPGKGYISGLTITSKAIWIRRVPGGMFRYQDGAWAAAPSLGLPDSPLQSRAVDAAGNAWFAFLNGSIARVGSNVTVFDKAQGLDIGPLSAIASIDGQVVAMGTLGAAVFDSYTSRFRPLKADQPDWFEGATGVVADLNHDVWVNSMKGLVRVPFSVWRSAIRDNAPLKGHLYGDIDGLPGAAAHYYAEGSLSLTSDDMLWVVRTGGVVLVDPRHTRRDSAAPQPQIVRIAADDKPQELTTTGKVDLPAGTRSIRLDYGALALTFPGRVRYSYRLKNYDKQWHDVDSRTSASFTNLPPGYYRFRLLAQDGDDASKVKEASLAFVVRPTFFQTIWFYLLLALGFVMLVAYAYSLRLRQLKRDIRNRLEARHVERERIARELHDSLLQGVQGLIIRLHVLIDKMPSEGTLRQSMETSLNQADHLLAESRAEVMGLRGGTPRCGALMQSLRAIGEEFAASSKTSFCMASDELPMPLGETAQDEIFRILREALVNAFRHSGAGRVALESSVTREAMEWTVADDGCGLSSAQVVRSDGHWGITGMHERAVAIGAVLDVGSHPDGKGTLVRLRLPVRRWWHRRRWLGRYA